MSRRSLVGVAVLGLFVGLGYVLPWAARAWQTHTDEQHLKTYTKPYMPLGRALAELPAPHGLTPARMNANPRYAIVTGFHWEGRGLTPEQAARAFEQDFRAVGSRPVARCSAGKETELCRVDATLAGQPFTVFISESRMFPTHAEVSPEMYLPPTGRWLETTPF